VWPTHLPARPEADVVGEVVSCIVDDIAASHGQDTEVFSSTWSSDIGEMTLSCTSELWTYSALPLAESVKSNSTALLML
jgi:hypothetical protein